MSEQSCGNCVFLRQQRCKRLPPQIVMIVSGGSFRKTATFPLMTSDQWCGEWNDRSALSAGRE